ncbi:POU domain, class 6, transcription factor 2 [Carcharodon carcharias]|uniref:POU domain, class 6, transcription factor 2 n=1 Tax=Carcharodon carcharias TaxID=13397 RepID=UPI001B7E062F|nr:POU domain, class 6, transcription factor 2 [Carcharodon carcharias]
MHGRNPHSALHKICMMDSDLLAQQDTGTMHAVIGQDPMISGQQLSKPLLSLRAEMNAESRGEDKATTSDNELSESLLVPVESNDSEDTPSKLFGTRGSSTHSETGTTDQHQPSQTHPFSVGAQPLLTAQQLASAVAGVMPTSNPALNQPILIPFNMAGQLGNQQGLVLTLPAANLTNIQGLVAAAAAGGIMTLPLQNLQATSSLNSQIQQLQHLQQLQQQQQQQQGQQQHQQNHQLPGQQASSPQKQSQSPGQGLQSTLTPTNPLQQLQLLHSKMRPVVPVAKVTVTLNLYAIGSSQMGAGDIVNMLQFTLRRCIRDAMEALYIRKREFIIPTRADTCQGYGICNKARNCQLHARGFVDPTCQCALDAFKTEINRFCLTKYIKSFGAKLLEFNCEHMGFPGFLELVRETKHLHVVQPLRLQQRSKHTAQIPALTAEMLLVNIPWVLEPVATLSMHKGTITKACNIMSRMVEMDSSSLSAKVHNAAGMPLPEQRCSVHFKLTGHSLASQREIAVEARSRLAFRPLPGSPTEPTRPPENLMGLTLPLAALKKIGWEILVKKESLTSANLTNLLQGCHQPCEVCQWEPVIQGVIDSTHVALSAPWQQLATFVNQKGFHSLNVQVACDHRKRIVQGLGLPSPFVPPSPLQLVNNPLASQAAAMGSIAGSQAFNTALSSLQGMTSQLVTNAQGQIIGTIPLMSNPTVSSNQNTGGTQGIQVQPITPQLLTNAQGQIIATVIGNQILPVINTQGITLSPIKPGQQQQQQQHPQVGQPVSQANLLHMAHGQPSLAQSPVRQASSSSSSSCSSSALSVGQLVSNPQTAASEVDGVNLEEIREFAKAFKIRRLSLGLTQTQVGQALSATEGPAYSQSAICRHTILRSHFFLPQDTQESSIASSLTAKLNPGLLYPARFEKLDITPKSAQKIKPVLERWMAEAEARHRAGMQNLTEFIGSEPSKKRKRRTSFTPQALEILNAHFEKNTHPSGQEMTEIAEKLNYDREVVRVWFCNKRQALKNTIKRLKQSESSTGLAMEPLTDSFEEAS